MDLIQTWSQLYEVPLVDYWQAGSVYDRDGRGLLVSSGCGIMMAVMDAVPALRWCTDIDGLAKRARLADFMECAAACCDFVAVCGWFSITDPAKLLGALARVPEIRRVVYMRRGVAGETDTLGAFIARCRAAGERAAAAKAAAQ